MDKKHGIAVISNSCGIKAHTLRIWEKRYNLFSPERSANGQRLYGADDIAKAKIIAALLKCGHSISSLAAMKMDELIELKTNQAFELAEANNQDSSGCLERILKYLSVYDLNGIVNELQHARLSCGAREFILEIVLPVIRDVGTLVLNSKYTITQEHIISTIIREQISQIYLPNMGKSGREFALATPEGNLHEFSILIADILCRSHRVTTRYLGATHPANCLAEAINALATPVLILGVISSDKWDYENQIIPYLKKIDEIIKSDLTVILGGGTPVAFPKFKNIHDIKIMRTFEEFDQYLLENY